MKTKIKTARLPGVSGIRQANYLTIACNTSDTVDSLISEIVTLGFSQATIKKMIIVGFNTLSYNATIEILK